MPKDTKPTVETLQRELRRTKWLLGLVATAGGAALLMGAVSKPEDARFGTITASASTSSSRTACTAW